MAEEVLYASAGSEVNKRKYEDSPSPVARRATGFSSAPDSGAPPPSYSSVPPPMNEIELAKQKAQEIAARLLSSSDPTKRARVEHGGNGVGGFDSSDYEKPMGSVFGGSAYVASSGYPGPGKKIEIPNGRVGVIIGKGGETIKYLQLQSGAKIQVTRDMDADPNSATREVDLTGTPDQIAKAERLIHDVLSEAEAGGSGSGSRRMTGQPSGAEQFVMKVPNNRVGLVIGKGGETIKSMQARTGARIQVIPLHLPPGDTSQERTVQIDGTSEQIEAAKQLVDEVISENRMRNSAMAGGYPQQGYQTRPATNWAQSGAPMQQPSYGYTQPGAYPGAPSQYNTNQPPYSGYPPQAAAPGGYAAGWDPSSAAQNQQGGAYGYYNQGQGYSQDGYGGYYAGASQSSYTQPQQNPTAGYDQQQQQGYNSTYGNVSNPTPDGTAASYSTQGEASQAPVPNTNYPPQASNQPGYGAQTTPSYGPPQVQKPSSVPTAYAPQQSPSAQGGVYAQPGYTHSQPPSGQASYAQTGYPTAQPGYAGQPYGAPPATQPSYGQQQPPSYSSSYSVGATNNAHGTYDATPPTQSAKPGGSAEASPPS